MKNLIKSRRGIAIEMAIGAMFVMMALSIILVSISGMQTKHMKSDLGDFEKKVEVYQVLDGIEKELNTDEDPFKDFTDNTPKIIKINEIDYTVNFVKTNTYTISKGNDVVLTLEIKTVTNNNITTNTITSWRD
jgi:hypothetical protein